MKAAILLYTYAGNSFRGAERAMEVFNFVFPFLGLDIPSHVTIREWVLKAGPAELCREKKAIEDYAIIVDESITIAEHKVLMTLAVLTSAAGLANASCRRFDKLFSFIGNLQLRRTVITVITLGIAAIGASFGMKALLQQGTTYVGYIGIPVLVIPAFVWVRTRLAKK